jgi:hypothetical protein
VVVAVVLPFAAVVVKDAQDPFGHLYYGHLQPATVTVSGTLPTAPETSAVYRYAEEESRTELITRLQSALDITTTCSEEAGTSTCAFGASRLFVFPRNEWAVYFAYADGSKGDRALVPPEAEARAEAEQALAEVGIDVSTLRYVGLADFGDNFAHVEFAAREQSGPEILWGAVMVTIGENGAVRDISDRQHRFTWVEDVRTTSPQAAIATAQDVGVLRVNMSADVSSVEPSFSFNADTGYLVPTWQITGELHQADGSDMPWTPAIDARAP